MDNAKTGLLIRQRRKELDMTQMELAKKLHLTDRAVSKWERGLSSPDIALLEPLAQALGLTVTELIRGERITEVEEREADVRQVLDYSRKELKRKVGGARKRTVAGVLFALLVVCIWGGVRLWNTGWLCTEDRIASPDGEKTVTVYGKAFGDWLEFSFRDATSLIMEMGAGNGYTRITYGGAEYRGLWWSPDGEKYVIALHYPAKGEDYLALNWLEYHRESNLNAYLSMGVEASELSRYGSADREFWSEIRYEFLQWGADSASMLIYYQFEDAQNILHEGYFWYNCETGTVSAVLELPAAS